MPFKDREKENAWRREYRKKNRKHIETSKKWRAKNKDYFKKWAKNNRDKVRASSKKWKEKNKDYCNKKTIEWHKNHPWVIAYNSAKNRCTNPKLHNYSRYGGRGIMFLMTRSQVKELWIRDNASEMICPTLDRINNDGHYEFLNCQFIPMRENVAKSNRERKK